jgi:exopolysaccharide biosynthesis polyprenyl glycosylphosphotransferase
MLFPAPLQGRSAWMWLKAMAADWALVGLNWLVVGAALVPLRMIFPSATFFEYAVGKPLPLVGLAILHASLITLVAHTEGIYATAAYGRLQAGVLRKCVAWSTIAVSLGAGLLTARWATAGLCCCAGLLNFAALQTWRSSIAQRAARNRERRKALVVCAGRMGRSIAQYLEEHPEDGRSVYGVLDDGSDLGNGVVGRVADLARLARTGFVDEVILAAPENSALALQVLREARRLRLDVEMVPELFGCKPTAREIERIGDLPLICLHAERLPAVKLAFKRLIDICISGLALVGLAPLLAAIAALIKLDSPGPIFYCAKRAGRKGAAFRCYKFRTMVSNAEELKMHLKERNERSGPCFKIANDPRITRVGVYLRRYSLDELPQLWNVLRGEMSLVGPRPHPLDDVAGYDIEHLARLDMTPGMTGLWQVTARRDPSFRRGMELDREYIRTWSLGLDMRILMKTFLAVTQGSGE